MDLGADRHLYLDVGGLTPEEGQDLQEGSGTDEKGLESVAEAVAGLEAGLDDLL